MCQYSRVTTILEDVLHESLDERGTISKLGKGWTESMGVSWFHKKTSRNEIKTTTSWHGRNISSSTEADESVLILKTLHSVRLDYDNETGRGYSMT